MRKVFIEANVQLTLNVDEGVEIGEIISALRITSSDDRADVDNLYIIDFQVTDSK